MTENLPSRQSLWNSFKLKASINKSNILSILDTGSVSLTNAKAIRIEKR